MAKGKGHQRIMMIRGNPFAFCSVSDEAEDTYHDFAECVPLFILA